VLFLLSGKGWTQEKFKKTLSDPVPFFIPKSSPVLRDFSMDGKKKVLNLSTSIYGIISGALSLVSHPTLWYK